MVRILGPVEVVGPDGVVELRGPKERCLLAVFTVNLGAAVPEALLVDALWDGAPPRTATKTLQNYVLRLRRRLDGCGDAAILTRPTGYVLDGLTTDAATARVLVAKGRRAAERGACAVAISRFDEALAQWRGPALAEFAHQAWAATEAAGLSELRASTAEERIAALLAVGRHRDAVAECDKLVAEEPLRERRWTQLMLALYRDGRQGEALEAFRRLRAVLVDELGVEPGPEARRLEAAILAHDPALRRRTSTRDSTCVGRDRELATLLEHLADATAGRGRATFLSGEPGIGKSRLLAELAAQAQARGVQVLSGRCLEGAGALPFHPFVAAIEAFLDGAPPTGSLAQLLHGPGEATGPVLRPDELRLRLLDGVARFLAGLAVETPVMLLVDDLHWADDGTVAMLRHVARSTTGHRLFLVGAYRGSEVGERHPLADALGALRSETDCAVLRVKGLDRVSVERLAGTTAGGRVDAPLLDALYAETQGNPFFVREVIHHLKEDDALQRGADGLLRTPLPLQAVPEGVR
jgi:DNA-binding SARP family transcriptional activator